ncbi:NADP-dependent oxidoreductase domain-containing protein [Zopfochytrium polystomum]|nr:NADP-dependent oxidoreductase domain-containing protein [Zopfochytrium polystomum]
MTTTTTTSSPTTNGLKIVFGAAGQLWNNPDNVPAVLKLLADAGIRNIDSARRYGPSEKIIGDHAVAATLTVDTKHPGGMQVPGGATKESILEVAAVSFDLLKTEQVDIYYLHAPDRKTPIADTLAGIDELHKQGRFRRFGLSNYLPDEVEEVVRVAKEHGYVLPTVYQGNYSAITRRPETELFPVLRRHGIAFYAYSPTAGGFLTKTRAAIESETAGGRFEKGAGVVADMYRSMYIRPAYLDALDSWHAVSAEAGVAPADLANRWIVYHSALRAELGDAVILGARTLGQLQGTIDGLRAGPLPEAVAQIVDAIWEQLKEHAVLDNFNDFIGAK